MAKKWVTKVLFLSLGLNGLLFCLLLFFTLREQFFLRPLFFSFALPRVIEPLSRSHPAFAALEEYDRFQLIEALTNHRLVAPTVRISDLALALLVEKYQFAIDQVVEIEKKESTEGEITFFHSLDKKDFAELYHYAMRERYPFTIKGLFNLLQQGEREEELVHLFMSKEPFQLVKRLFQKTKIEDQKLLELLVQGEWEWIDSFYQRQKGQLSFSEGERVRFLRPFKERFSGTGS